MNFGARLRALRMEKNLTQEDLGKILKVGKASISGYENETRQPDNESLVTLANYFGVTVDYLLGNKSTPKWADKNDIIELHDFLNSNAGMAFEGVNLSPEQKQRVNEILTQVFWDEIKKEKNRKSSDEDE